MNRCRVFSLIALCLSPVQLTFAQTSTATASALPRLVRFGGTIKDASGSPLTGVAGITFALYAEQTGGAPLWQETQNVTADSTGHYTALLGATKSEGLAAELFTSEQAHWVGVQVQGQIEQPRVLLVSAPYALKAGDAETIGGLPPSAFVLAAPLASGSATAGGTTPSTARSDPAPAAATDVTTTGGTAGFLPLFNGSSTIVDSVVVQSGTGSTAKIGINAATPTATLDVGGSGTFHGALNLPATGAATATAGDNSEPLNLTASVFNGAAVAQTFQLRAEPVSNDTTAASGALSLLYGSGTGTPAETGLKIASNGQITFATGQPFPGAADLTANTFTGNQSVTGNVTASGTVQGAVVAATTGFNLGGALFAYGSFGNFNAFLGFGGNEVMTGQNNTAVGVWALESNTAGASNTAVGALALSQGTGNYNTATGAAALASTTGTAGSYNTADGATALSSNITGAYNTADGVSALWSNTTGNYNTALGYSAGTDSSHTGLTNATAIGANATVSQNNTLVLGQTTAGKPGASWVDVGIGTAVPGSTLEAYVTKAGSLGPTLTLSNGGIGSGTASSLDFNTYPPAYGGSVSGPYNPSARIEATDDGSYSSNLIFSANSPGGQNQGLVTTMTIFSNGNVIIGGESYYSNPTLGALTAFANIQNYCGDNCSQYGVVAYGDRFEDAGGGGVMAVGGQGAGLYPGGDGIDAYPGTGTVVGYAGNFNGDLNVTGAIMAGTKDFKIDHPLDPANKYLFHASVESSEMKNIYDGNVTTNSQGLATVQLPDWFEVLNSDFRYQLTVIGQFAQAIVSGKVANHQFSIMTDKPNVEVSWQITGVRHDAYAEANPLVVEQEKDTRERGYYIHPELYGAPEERSIEWARHPKAMKNIREVRARQLAESQKRAGTTRAAAQPLAAPPGLKETPPPGLPAPRRKPAPEQKPSEPGRK